MSELKIDIELENLLPQLEEEKYKLLEEDIKNNGCINPIIIWNGYIVDGHHRYRICKANNIDFKTKEMEFENKQEAMIWAWTTQKARRNIDDGALFKIAKAFKPYYEKKAKENKIIAAENTNAVFHKCEKAEKEEIKPINTTKKLAEIAGTSHNTMNKVIQVQKHAPQPVQRAVENNGISINKGYEITRQVKGLPEEEKEEKAFNLLNEALIEKTKKEDTEDERKARNAKKINNVIYDATIIEINKENVECWLEGKKIEDIKWQEKNVDEAIENFKKIKEIMQEYKGIRRVI